MLKIECNTKEKKKKGKAKRSERAIPLYYRWSYDNENVTIYLYFIETVVTEV